MTQPNSRLQSIMEQQQRARARAAPGGSAAFPEGLVEWTRTCVDEWYRLYNRQQEAANVPIEALIEASQAGDGGPRADAAAVKKLQEELKAKHELEDLQSKNIFSLLKEVTIKGIQAKCLYLTNRQARMLNLENMDKFVMAMDFEPRPKLVINLFEAFASFGHNAYDHGHWSYRKGDIDGDPSVAHGEPAGERGLSETERRLGEFIKDSLLPIAIESNAVIIMGANHCSFSSIFSALSQREAARCGGRLPFYTLCVVDAMHINENTKVAGTNSNTLHKVMPRWKKNAAKLEAMLLESMGAPAKNRYCNTFVPPATHYIIVDAIEEGQPGQSRDKFDTLPTKTLRSYITARFAETLPSLAFGAFAAKDGWEQMQRFSKYTSRGLPLFLVDTKIVPKATTRPQTDDVLAAFSSAKASSSGGRDGDELARRAVRRARLGGGDEEPAWLEGASDKDAKWLRTAAYELLRRDSELEALPQGYNGYHAGDVSYLVYMLHRNSGGHNSPGSSSKLGASSTRGKYIHEVMAMHEEVLRERREGAAKRADVFKQNIRRCADLLVWLDRRRAKAYLEKWHKHRAAQLDEFSTAIASCANRDAIDATLAVWFTRWCGTLVRTSLEAAPRREGRCARVVRMFPDVFEQTVVSSGPHKCFAEVPRLLERATIEAAVDAVAGFQAAERSKVVYPDAVYMANDWLLDTYSGLQDVLGSEHTYAGSLAEPERLKLIVESVAEIDRLPKCNTIQGMHILRTAWNKVDMYAHVAQRCKIMSKVCYALLLMLSLASTSLVMASAYMPRQTVSAKGLNQYVLVLTLLTTVNIAFITYVKPEEKWKQLRAASEALIGEMWKFRTRSGHYQQNPGDPPNQTSELFKEFVDDIATNVMKSATVANTAFFARAKGLSTPDAESAALRDNALYRHGQYRSPPSRSDKRCGCRRKTPVAAGYGPNDGCLWDDHQSPCTPEEYLQLRVLPRLQFYQGRLPTYQRLAGLWESLLLASSICGVVLSFFQEARWSPIPIAVTICITAYAEFHDTERKLVRYSEAISRVDSVKMWWDSLSNVEKVSLACVTTLVSTCEDAFADEREAWGSSSVVSAEMDARSGRGPSHHSSLNTIAAGETTVGRV